jgi:hypothetical protein
MKTAWFAGEGAARGTQLSEREAAAKRDVLSPVQVAIWKLYDGQLT